MLKRYRIELTINAARARVVEKFENMAALGAWQPGFIKAEELSGVPGKVGSQTRLIYNRAELIETITVMNLPEEFAATFEAKGMKMTVSNRFEEIDGGTRWISDNQAELSGFMIKAIAFLMPGCFEKQSRIYCENFKAWVEEGKDLREED